MRLERLLKNKSERTGKLSELMRNLMDQKPSGMTLRKFKEELAEQKKAEYDTQKYVKAVVLLNRHEIKR